MRVVIFTDLDGTLLDDNYSFKKALLVLKKLREKKVPIIFCSAKTRAEQEVIRKKMAISHPFIVENGSAIYVPKNYFGEKVGRVKGKYEVIVLGVSSKKIREEIKKVKRKYRIKGYFDMSYKDVAEVTGLDSESAKLAKRREFSETIIDADKKALKELKKKFSVVSGGRFIQVFGKGADKGKAVKILAKLYRRFGEVLTLGIGNAENDKRMLVSVDKPAIVKNGDGSWVDLKIKSLYKAEGIGPVGWVEVIKKFVLKNKFLN